MEALIRHSALSENHRPAPVRTADDVYRYRLCAELLDAEPRPAARTVPEYRPAGRRDQLSDHPCFARLADRFGRRRVYITGALIGTLSARPSLWRWRLSLCSGLSSPLCSRTSLTIWWSAQQPMFTELFGASYRYSGAGVGYQWQAWSAAGLRRLLPPRW